MLTRFTSDANAAFKAPVTEVAFISAPNGTGDEVKTKLEENFKPIGETIKMVGKALEAAFGWCKLKDLVILYSSRWLIVCSD